MKLQHILEATIERTVSSVIGRQADKMYVFNITYKQLTNLKGSPTIVESTFDCTHNELISLEGGPTTVGGDCYLYDNKLTNLKGGPTEVGSIFSCGRNQLTSLEGAPTSIGGSLFCNGNKLTSLKDIHKQIKEIEGAADFSGNPITSHVLGLLKIKGLIDVELDNKAVEAIINTHLTGTRNIFDCQGDLLDAGLDAFAQL